MMRSTDVVKEINEWVESVGEQRAVEILNAHNVPIKTISELVRGKYKKQPRSFLRRVLEAVLLENSDRAS